jgi:3-hydroxyacyl-CoA dehydrogenase
VKDGKPVRQQLLADALCEAGRFGQKTGGGWYDYAAGGRQALPSALVAEMQGKLQQRPPRAVADEEIVQRLLLALGIEGQRLLSEGIALRASDIDLVYLSGYGFPRWRGGPMHQLAKWAPEALLQVRQRYAADPHDDRSLWLD